MQLEQIMTRDPLVITPDLEALLRRATESLDEAVPLIAAVLGVLGGGERYSLPDLTPQRQKQRTLEVLVDQLEGLAADQPVLLVYEDVHWIDPTTLELLDLAIERVQRLTVLTIVTYPPEFAPRWSGQPHVTALPLARLGRRDGALMVDRVVGEDAAGCGARRDSRQDRRRAAVCRGADQDSAGVGTA